MGSRRGGFFVTNILFDVIDEIRDFVDDSILDRDRGPDFRRGDSDIVDLRMASDALTQRVSGLDGGSGTSGSDTKASGTGSRKPARGGESAAESMLGSAGSADPLALAGTAISRPDAVVNTFLSDPFALVEGALGDPKA
jgi:hypothetical protein